mmetsp:Transcript_15764/g.27734  ORF Transcript_15764/g.27734 Transcript_15764/m.27734 type:complete len:204 (+) Transcript_15764:1533-2144(+)
MIRPGRQGQRPAVLQPRDRGVRRQELRALLHPRDCLLHRHDLGIPVAAALQELLVQLLLQGLKPLLLLLQGLFRVLLHQSLVGHSRALRPHGGALGRGLGVLWGLLLGGPLLASLVLLVARHLQQLLLPCVPGLLPLLPSGLELLFLLRMAGHQLVQMAPGVRQRLVDQPGPVQDVLFFEGSGVCRRVCAAAVDLVRHRLLLP